MALAYKEVLEAKDNISFKNKTLINGNFVNSVSNKMFEDISPVDGKIVTSVAECDVKDVDMAVKAAREVFE